MRFLTRTAVLASVLAALMLALVADPAAARGSHRSKHHYKGAHVAKKAKETLELPKGTLQIVVSIGDQRVTVYNNGVLFAHAPVSTGVRNHPTPMGVFSVIGKKRFHRSNLYSSAPMPFMQRITWSGVALHAGPLPGYPASHGCIRLPDSFARKLWRYTKIGARVIIARQDVPPQEIAHPKLFTPVSKPVAQSPAGDKSTAASTPVPAVQTAETIDPAKATDAPRPEAAKSTDSGKPTVPYVGLSPADLTQFDKPEPPAPKGPVSVFVSRKTGKLYVRKGTVPMFESPVVIRNPDQPFGTHVFTAMAATDNGAGMSWTVQTMPPEPPRHVKRHRKSSRKSRRHRRQKPEQAELPPVPSPPANEVLDRIEMPAYAVERIEKWLSPGSSLIVSDHRMSEETGAHTDFIVETR